MKIFSAVTTRTQRIDGVSPGATNEVEGASHHAEPPSARAPRGAVSRAARAAVLVGLFALPVAGVLLGTSTPANAQTRGAEIVQTAEPMNMQAMAPQAAQGVAGQFRITAAQDHYQQAQLGSPEDKWVALEKLLDVWLSEGQPFMAIEQLKGVDLTQAPDNIAMPGRIFYRQGQAEEALGKTEQAFESYVLAAKKWGASQATTALARLTVEAPFTTVDHAVRALEAMHVNQGRESSRMIRYYSQANQEAMQLVAAALSRWPTEEAAAKLLPFLAGAMADDFNWGSSPDEYQQLRAQVAEAAAKPKAPVLLRQFLAAMDEAHLADLSVAKLQKSVAIGLGQKLNDVTALSDVFDQQGDRLARDKPAEALARYQIAVQVDPSNGSAGYGIALLISQHPNLDPEGTLLAQISSPPSEEAVAKMGVHDLAMLSRQHAQVARMLEQKNPQGGASVAAQRAEQVRLAVSVDDRIFEQNPNIKPTAQFRLDLADALVQAGQPTQAAATLFELVSLDNEPSVFLLGQLAPLAQAMTPSQLDRFKTQVQSVLNSSIAAAEAGSTWSYYALAELLPFGTTTQKAQIAQLRGTK